MKHENVPVATGSDESQSEVSGSQSSCFLSGIKCVVVKHKVVGANVDSAPHGFIRFITLATEMVGEILTNKLSVCYQF